MNPAKAARNICPDVNAIALENTILKVAIAHIDLRVFDYNRDCDTLRFVDSKTPPMGLPTLVSDPVGFVEQHGLMETEYLETLRRLFARNLSGEEMVSDTLLARSSPEQKESRWYNVVLANYLDPADGVNRVVGTIQDVTDRVLSELRYSKEEQYRMAMLADNRRVYEINVTRDRFMQLESINDSTDVDQWNPYDATMAHICKTQVYQEDWEDFLQVATRDNLLTAFEMGQNEFHCEYRAYDGKGGLSWSASTTHLLRDPVSGEVKGFIYAQDIDSQKRQELLLRRQAERDPLTGVYNRSAAERVIEKALSESAPGQFHGFLSVDIDDFKTVNDTFGHLQGDLLLQKVAEGFTSILRENDVLARMGGDEFIVFLYDVVKPARVFAIARRLCEFVHTICLNNINDFHFSISVGIGVSPDNGTSFVELYKYSDAALYYAKQHGKDRVATEF